MQDLREINVEHEKKGQKLITQLAWLIKLTICSMYVLI